jgi:chromosome segregation ATPase
MNHPTREEFERLAEEQKQLKEEVRRLREQVTEPIKIDRLELDRGGTQELLKEANKKLERIIQTQTDRSEKFDKLEHGQRELSKKQEEHARLLIAHSRSISALQEEMKGARADIAAIKATQSDHGEMLKNMATKEDISTMKGEISTLKKNQGEQHEMLRQILRLLGQKD